MQLAASEPDTENWKQGLGNRLGWKCTEWNV